MGSRVWLAGWLEGWLEGWLAIATQQVSQSTQLGRHRFPGRQAGLASQRADSPQGLTQGVGWRHGEPIGPVTYRNWASGEMDEGCFGGETFKNINLYLSSYF